MSNTTEKTAVPLRKGRMLWSFLGGCKGLFLLSIFFAACKALFDLFLPQLIRYTVDTVLSDQPSALPQVVNDFIDQLGGVSAVRENLWWLAIAAVCIGLLAVASRYLDMLFGALASEKLVMRMRDMLFSHMLHLPSSFYQKNHTGDLVQRCTSDVETIKRFLSEQLTSLFRVVLLLALSLSFMFSMNATLSLIALCLLPVILAYSTYFGARVRRGFRICDENEGILSGIAQENLTGVRVVRAFGREDYERRRFAKQNEYYTSLWVGVQRNMSTFWTVGDLISGIQVLLVIVFGCVMCVQDGMTSGEFIAFTTYNTMLIWPIRQLGRIISEMSRAGVAMDRIAEILSAEPEATPAAVADVPLAGDIVFDHVSFGYAGGPLLLQDVSFTLPQGATLGILGGTGAGKSTLVALLTRLYELPEGQGTISIGGRDIRTVPLPQLRRHIGTVLQEPFLFSRNIAQNISITQTAPDEAAVRAAAQNACFDESVMRFADGYETEVGERGVTLSGGQKQRCAIARLLLTHAPVMVLDDSLSAVDTETDEKIRAHIAQETADTSVILISHRITTLMGADAILVLEGGRVAEYGTPQALLAQNGLFRQVYDMQSGMIQGEVTA